MFAFLPLAIPVAGLFISYKMLNGENLGKYDQDYPLHKDCNSGSDGLKKVNDFLYENFTKPGQNHKGGEPVTAKRKRFDSLSATRKFPVNFKPAEIKTEWGSLSGEWISSSECNPDKRILYIHGGAFTVGSNLSHRPITAALAKKTGAAVFALNYRLMPEHSRMSGVIDCRTAYDWVLENGPDGPFIAKTIAIGGDSAGGNLSLSLLQYLRDNKKRTPNACFCLSPLTDCTFSGKTIKSNLDSDKMLKPLLGEMLKIPRPLLLSGMWIKAGIMPSAPVLSPVFGKLHDLPPTLIQVSNTEILFDDAKRYTTKAHHSGSDVKLQIFSHMPHVWQIFDNMLPEAEIAMDDIAAFLKDKL